MGGGPAGLTAAIALAGSRRRDRAGRRARPCAATTAPPRCSRARSRRSTRSASGSAAAEQAAPLRVMRIVDDTARLLRAPEVCFAASEIGLDAFGYNIENRFLLAALDSARARVAGAHADRGRRRSGRDRGEPGHGPARGTADGVSARLGDRRRRAALALPRRGRHRRPMARSYPQTALTFNLAPQPAASTTPRPNSIPRPARSRWCRCPGLRSSLVFVVDPAEAPRLLALVRRRARGRDRAALAFDPRQDRRSSQAAACFRSRSRPRGASARAASC